MLFHISITLNDFFNFNVNENQQIEKNLEALS